MRILRRLKAVTAGFCAVAGLLSLAAMPMVVQAQDALASFTGSVTTPPQVDAITFSNKADWNIFVSPYPYRTAHTLYYYNGGGKTMTSRIGWDFGYAPSTVGVRGPSATFLNDNNSSIVAVDGGDLRSFLLVTATNITSKGTLTAGPGGQIKLSGTTVNLSRSKIQIQPLASTGDGSVIPDTTTYFGDVGIYDQAWGVGTNDFVPASTVEIQPGSFTNVLVTTNSSLVSTNYYINSFGKIRTGSPGNLLAQQPCSLISSSFNLSGRVDTYLASSLIDVTNMPAGPNNAGNTNIITGYADWKTSYSTVTLTNGIVVPTNLIVQAVYVRVRDTNLSAQIHFNPSTEPNNSAYTASVWLQTFATNVATLQSELAGVCLTDTMISETNSGLSQNLNPNLVSGCSGSTYRPANYTVSRQRSGDFNLGAPGIGTPTNDVIWDAGYITNIMNQLNQGNADVIELVTNAQTEYVGSFIRGGGYSVYSAYVDNLLSPPPAAFSSVTNFPGAVHIYATNLDLTLAKIRAEGGFFVEAGNLTPSSTNSVVDCQSLSYNIGSTNGYLHFQNLAKTNVNRLNGTISVWSETWTNIIEQVFAAGTTNAFTNAIPTTLYVMVLDASALSTIAPVYVYDLKLHATNILVSDKMVVQQSLLLDGSSFTLDTSGQLTLGTYLPNWTYTNMPGVRFFTNNGTITVTGHPGTLANNADFGSDGPTALTAFVNHGTINCAGMGVRADYMELAGTTNGFNNVNDSGLFTAEFNHGLCSNTTIYANSGVYFQGDSLKVMGSTVYSADLINLLVTNNLSDGGQGVPNFLTCANGFNLPMKPATGDLLGTVIDSVIYGGSEIDHVWAGLDYGRDPIGYLNNAALGSLTLTAVDPGQYPLFYFYGPGSKNALYVDLLDISSLGDQFENLLGLADNFKIYFNRAIVDPSLTDARTTAEQYLDGKLGGHLIWMGPSQSANIIFGAQTTQVSNSGLQFSVNGVLFPQGLALSNTVIQASTNLVNWVDVYTNQPPFTYTNFDYTNYPRRFYRAKQGW